MKNIILTSLTVVAALLPTCLLAQSVVPDLLPEKTPDDTLQLVRVYVPIQEESRAFVVCFERDSATSDWKVQTPVMKAMIGRNGLAPQGEKREKDGRSPQAEYAVGFLFGVEPTAPEGVKLPYRQATNSDFWIDEGEDPRYNCWHSGQKPDVSHENLILQDPRYDLCLTSQYNVNPTTPSKGSAIFLHIWKEPNYPTSGCVSLSRENVLAILRWLDPAKRPHIRLEVGSPEL